MHKKLEHGKPPTEHEVIICELRTMLKTSKVIIDLWAKGEIELLEEIDILKEKLKEVMGRDPEKGYYYFHEWEAQRRVDKKASDLTNNNENAWIQP